MNILCFILAVQTGELGITRKVMNGQTLPNLVTPCFANASWSIMNVLQPDHFSGYPCFSELRALSLK